MDLQNSQCAFGITGIVVFILCLMLTPACNRIPSEYREFLNLSIENQHAELRKFPIDKQIDYYLAATTYVHPPAMELGDVIASRGKEALPFLVKSLREEKKEHRQISLMHVFEEMNRRYYNLKDEQEALDLLKEVTAKMEDHKARAERILAVILENRPANLQELKEKHPEYFPPKQ